MPGLNKKKQKKNPIQKLGQIMSSYMHNYIDTQKKRVKTSEKLT